MLTFYNFSINSMQSHRARQTEETKKIGKDNNTERFYIFFKLFYDSLFVNFPFFKFINQ